MSFVLSTSWEIVWRDYILKSMIEILFSFFIVLSDNRLVEIENFKIEILLFRSRRASIFFFRREFVEDRFEDTFV